MKQQVLRTIYNFGGFAPFHNLNQRKVLILMYRRFSESEDSCKISEKEFEEHLTYLVKHNTVMGLDELIDSRMSGKELPPNPTVITIDDGYSDAYDIAFPLLEKFNIPATIYVITDFLDGKIWLWTDIVRYLLLESDAGFFSYEHPNGELVESELNDDRQKLEVAGKVNAILEKLTEDEKKFRIKEIAKSLEVKIPQKPTEEFAPLTWEQTRKMDKGVVKIESSTRTHPILRNLDSNQLGVELLRAKEKLEIELERKVEHLCYRKGSLNGDVKTAAEKAGYKSAVTTDYGFNNGRANMFLLKRIEASPDIENFAQSVSGFEAMRQKINL